MQKLPLFPCILLRNEGKTDQNQAAVDALPFAAVARVRVVDWYESLKPHANKNGASELSPTLSADPFVCCRLRDRPFHTLPFAFNSRPFD